jgi:hypothetical protein
MDTRTSNRYNDYDHYLGRCALCQECSRLLKLAFCSYSRNYHKIKVRNYQFFTRTWRRITTLLSLSPLFQQAVDLLQVLAVIL